MPRKSTRSANGPLPADTSDNGVGDVVAVSSFVAVEAESTSAIGSVVESVRREIDRLAELQELLQSADVDLAERERQWHQEREAQRLAAERFRRKHLKRLARYRRLRHGFRELESRERCETGSLREEVQLLRAQLAEAAAMLESARDASFMADDEHKTEQRQLLDSLDAAEQRAAEAEAQSAASVSRIEHLTRELDEACEQIIRLESQLESAADSSSVDSDAVSALERQLEELRLDNETLKEKCSDLLEENSSLANEIADLRIAKTSVAPAAFPVESMTWEQRKAAILEQLRREEQGESISHRESQSIRQMLEKTELEITRRDEELAELRELLEQQSATIQATPCGDGVAIGAAGIAMMFDNDALIQEERDRLKEIQAEWEEKLRQAEVELSLERAKLARGRRELEQKELDLSQRLNQMEKDGEDSASPENKNAPRRRWFKHLGLGDGA